MNSRNSGLKQCPSCEAFQDATRANCPNCGYDLTNVTEKGKATWPWQAKAFTIGVGVLLLDFIIGWCVTDLFEVVSQPFLWAIIYLVYAVCGMALATVVFKEQHALSLVFTSLGTTLVLRCAFVALMFPVLHGRLAEPFQSVGLALAKAFWGTLIQAVYIYLPLLAGMRFLRKTEMQFGFAEPTDVKWNADSDFDEGTCKTCGKRTVIAVSRSLPFLGKSDRYFCQHCHSFIGGNPLVSTLQGIAEGVTASFFFVCLFAGMIASTSGQPPTDYRSLVLLVLIVGAFDGLRKVVVSSWVFVKLRHAR